MPTLTLVVGNKSSEIIVPCGAILSELILQAEHHIAQPCAGKGRCGKCRVIASGELSDFCEEEKKHLSQFEIKLGTRLACCTRVLGNASVVLSCDTSEQICVDTIMPAFEHKPLFAMYGAVIDIGTTTLAAQLYSAKGLLCSSSMPNPQGAYGADVISRIEKAINGSAAELAACVRSALCTMLLQMSSAANINVAVIDTIVITANTAMLYLLTQASPKSLSHAPFIADRLFGEIVLAESLGLPCVGASVYLPRCISAFVGADITTAILASEICSCKKTAILTDIGTNGEIALWHKGALTCCSTAAGPAFEGAGISMGMGGKNGAIDHVEIKAGALHAHVIGNNAPIGICGSGIVDAVACLLKLDSLDEGGALTHGTAVISPPVCISGQDIRKVQLAKGAICAGIKTLTQIKGIDPAQVQSLFIAGGFGSYLNVENAAEIGLIPKELATKAVALGNAALTGAAMLLLNSDFLQFSNTIAENATTIELSTSSVFMDLYVESMLFE